VEYLELRPPLLLPLPNDTTTTTTTTTSDTAIETYATDSLTAFVNSTRRGGGNHAATIILGQISFLPEKSYDVFMTLLLEDDAVDRFRSSRKFVMRDFINRGHVMQVGGWRWRWRMGGAQGC